MWYRPRSSGFVVELALRNPTLWPCCHKSPAKPSAKFLLRSLPSRRAALATLCAIACVNHRSSPPGHRHHTIARLGSPQRRHNLLGRRHALTTPPQKAKAPRIAQASPCGRRRTAGRFASEYGRRDGARSDALLRCCTPATSIRTARCMNSASLLTCRTLTPPDQDRAGRSAPESLTRVFVRARPHRAPHNSSTSTLHLNSRNQHSSIVARSAVHPERGMVALPTVGRLYRRAAPPFNNNPLVGSLCDAPVFLVLRHFHSGDPPLLEVRCASSLAHNQARAPRHPCHHRCVIGFERGGLRGDLVPRRLDLPAGPCVVDDLSRAAPLTHPGGPCNGGPGRQRLQQHWP